MEQLERSVFSTKPSGCELRAGKWVKRFPTRSNRGKINV